MKDVGLVGAPYSGKSTLFTALTRVGTAGGRPNRAVVAVPDPRLDVLARLERSRRVSPARIRFVDPPGGTTPQALGELREADALCVVVRAFGPDARPAAELEGVRAELLLADLVNVESSLENARKRRAGRSPGSGTEVDALERAHSALSADALLREASLDPEHRLALRGLAPLTLKPWVVVANLEEGAAVPEDLPAGTVGVHAELEAETAGMAPEEARALLREFGVERPGLEAVISACYGALDLVTFLTTGEEETRAWEVPRGATALEAAGTVHSDFRRGFIRAEVVSFDDLAAAGGWDAARSRGLMRVEGKDYAVREGDVLHVRFAV